MLEVKEKASTLVHQKGWKDALLNKARMEELAKDAELTFEDVMFVTKHLMPRQMVPLMNVYAKSVKRLQHVRDAFEYAATYMQKELLIHLLNVHKHDELLEEWILVYHLFSDFVDGKINEEQMFERSRVLFAYVKNPLVRIRLEFIEFTMLYKVGSLSESKLLEKRARALFKKLQPSFMKTMLASRVSLLIGSIKLYREGDIDLAESHLLAVVVNETTPAMFKCSAHHSLGSVHVHRGDHSSSVNYLKKAILYIEQAIVDGGDPYAKAYKEELVCEYLPFVQNIRGDIFDVTNVKEEERVHQYVVRGQYKKALELIELMEGRGENSPFLLYYKGLALKSIPLLLDAMDQFAKNNAYMIKLVKDKINELSYN